ncbi:hypothetical protein SI65_00829 [Aspergillus cristatus]|uniref:Uncharacterized protein n=1 Tax=Aspergillus cristatus TaxID=573508 RepID=A0A1E3BQL4_ASPCR|nr:hypothetical protein SI65_00829 [Aspergillus cristatus]
MGHVVTEADAKEHSSTQLFSAEEGWTVGFGSILTLFNAAILGSMMKQVKNEWGHEEPGTIAMDIITMASVALQMASAIIPGVGLAVAIVGIGMTILEWVILHTPPSDLVEDYINSKVKTMAKDLNVRPPALLTYEVSPNIALNFNFSQI